MEILNLSTPFRFLNTEKGLTLILSLQYQFFSVEESGLSSTILNPLRSVTIKPDTVQ